MGILPFPLGHTFFFPPLPSLFLGICIILDDLHLRNRCDRILRRFVWMIGAHAVFPPGWWHFLSFAQVGAFLLLICPSGGHLSFVTLFSFVLVGATCAFSFALVGAIYTSFWSLWGPQAA